MFLTNATFRSEARNLIDKYKQSDFFVKQFNSKIEEKGDMFNEEKVRFSYFGFLSIAAIWYKSHVIVDV